MGDKKDKDKKDKRNATGDDVPSAVQLPVIEGSGSSASNTVQTTNIPQAVAASDDRKAKKDKNDKKDKSEKKDKKDKSEKKDKKNKDKDKDKKDKDKKDKRNATGDDVPS